jgi:hypothetical protein
MKLSYLATAAAAVTLLGGAAYAQQPQPPAAPTPGSVTGDWNGAHAPSDDKQYQDKVTVPLGSAPADQSSASTGSATVSSSTSTDVTAPASAPAATSYAQGASFTATTLTNGPVPDTPQNRKKYGQPLSNAGKRTAARGN